MKKGKRWKYSRRTARFACAAVGQIVFTADAAVEAVHKRKRLSFSCAELHPKTSMAWKWRRAFLPSRGGMTSHAAVVTRGMGKCCVAGAGDVDVNERRGNARQGAGL